MKVATELDVYVVDVCGTLVRDDTTLGLLNYHFSREPRRRVRYLIYQAITVGRSPLRLCFVIGEMLTGRHLLKHLAVRMLAGDKVIDLARSADEYAALLLSGRCVPSVWSLIQTPLQAGRVVLASASLDPIVAALASTIGARHVASTLEQRNGVLTGRFAVDLTGQKEQAMIRKYGHSVLTGQVCVISDNFSDRSLLEKAEKAYVVLHRASHRERWKALDATFLELEK